ncbi:hypothetical protein NIES4101_54750 [Calothrix sp. NIES-4101]|nr:hypothetical protein NIES4101_54750 [Calothrix sp. NIES-4101]
MFKLATFWKWLYSDWEVSIEQQIPGYTILLPVPGDLPVFLKIALETCSTQKNDNLVESIILPDKSVSGFAELLKDWESKHFLSPIRLINPQPFEQLISRYQNNPHNNHWLQLIRGINATRTTHALLHDADLFITQDEFMKAHYQTCNQKNLACLGVSPVWDTWYKEKGIKHLTATWEMMFSLEWARSFRPWEHRGHNSEIAGNTHTFDTTLYTQCHTPAERISYQHKEWGFIHFNYVICTYRWFQKSKGTFEDESFRILLIRLLINAFDDSAWKYYVPEVDELVKGITDTSNCVTYTQQKTRENYREFRSKLQMLIDSPILNDDKATILSEGACNFDRAFY